MVVVGIVVVDTVVLVVVDDFVTGTGLIDVVVAL